jgi:cytidine deaminase
MQENKFEFTYKVFDDIRELSDEQCFLLSKAREVTEHAYAPYSNFKVGAAAKLANGKLVTGSNQENASFPVGLCAERVLVGAISSLYPAIPIEAIAISYNSDTHPGNYPIAPCGCCRQTLQELENRVKHPIQLILGGKTGVIYVIDGISNLLPFPFSSEELDKR